MRVNLLTEWDPHHLPNKYSTKEQRRSLARSSPLMSQDVEDFTAGHKARIPRLAGDKMKSTYKVLPGTKSGPLTPVSKDGTRAITKDPIGHGISYKHHLMRSRDTSPMKFSDFDEQDRFRMLRKLKKRKNEN